MIVNGFSLLKYAPIDDMQATKQYAHGVSWGMSEAGYDIRIKQDVTLGPECRFLLASTVERFDMPYDLVGIVHDKSSHARRGLSVLNTVLEPGWAGYLTLELAYFGSEPLHIPAGSGIAQVVFHRTTDEAAYNGRYQDQANEPVPAIVAVR